MWLYNPKILSFFRLSEITLLGVQQLQLTAQTHFSFRLAFYYNNLHV